MGSGEGLTTIDLLARVKAATEADEELEYAIIQRFYGAKEEAIHRNYFISRYNVTASIDAALALVDKQGFRLYTVDASIPDSASVMLMSVEKSPQVDDEGQDYIGYGYAGGVHSVLTLAILAALLAALAGDRT